MLTIPTLLVGMEQSVMTNINDLRYQKLGRQGYTGTINDRYRAWLIATGLKTGNSHFRDFLNSGGYDSPYDYWSDPNPSVGSSTFHDFVNDYSYHTDDTVTNGDGFFTTSSTEQFVIEPDGSYNNTLTNKIPRSGNGAYVFEGFTSLLPYNGDFGNAAWIKDQMTIADSGIDNGLDGTYKSIQRTTTGTNNRIVEVITSPSSAEPYTIELPLDTSDIGISDFFPFQLRNSSASSKLDFCYQHSTDTFTIEATTGAFSIVSSDTEVFDGKVMLRLSILSDTDTQLRLYMSARDTSGLYDAADTSATAYQNIGPIQLVQSDKFFPHAGETTGASIAIGATSVSCATSELGFGAVGGMIIMDVDMPTTISGNPFVISVRLNSANRWSLYLNGTSLMLQHNVSGSPAVNETIATNVLGASFRIASGYNGAVLETAVNGVLNSGVSTADGLQLVPQPTTHILADASSAQLNSIIRSLTTYPEYDAGLMVSETA